MNFIYIKKCSTAENHSRNLTNTSHNRYLQRLYNSNSFKQIYFNKLTYGLKIYNDKEQQQYTRMVHCESATDTYAQKKIDKNH